MATAGLLASSTRGPAGYRYLDALYGIKGISKYFDAVAVHPYAEDARGVEGELTRIRQRHAPPRRRAHAGLDLRARLGHRRRQPLLLTTPAEQAARLTRRSAGWSRNRRATA